MSTRPPAYVPPPTRQVYPSVEVTSKSHYAASRQNYHNPYKYGRQFEDPSSVSASKPDSTPPSILETAFERAGFWLFFLYTVWIFVFSMCVLVLTSADFGLLPMAFLQLFEMVLAVDLNIPSLGLFISVLSALLWSSIVLNFLHTELPQFFRTELKKEHLIWHHTRRDWVMAIWFTLIVSLYAVFSYGWAMCLIDGDKGLGGENTMNVMLVGARWTVSVCFVAGVALVAFHWRNAEQEVYQTQVLFEDFS